MCHGLSALRKAVLLGVRVDQSRPKKHGLRSADCAKTVAQLWNTSIHGSATMYAMNEGHASPCFDGLNTPLPFPFLSVPSQ